MALNSSTTSAANTAVTATVTGIPGLRVFVYRIDVYSSAGTAGLTVTDGGTVVYRLPTTFVTTTPTAITWTKPLESNAPGNTVVIALSAAGGGNTTTLNVQADQYA
jgi:hypothetical protein